MPTATATDLAWWCLSAAVLAAVIAAALGGAIVVLVRRIGELEADVGEAIADKTACPDQWRISALERYADGGMANQPKRGRHSAAGPQTHLQPVPSPGGQRRRWSRPPPQPDPRTSGLLAGPRPPSWPPR
jgi:hypothetical protein